MDIKKGIHETPERTEILKERIKRFVENISAQILFVVITTIM